MRRTAAVFAAALSAFLCLTQALRAANRIENVTVTESDDGQSSTVIIETTLPLKYSMRNAGQPAQIEVRMGEDVNCEQTPPKLADKKLISGLRYNFKGSSKLLDSITIALNRPCAFRDSQKDWLLSIALTPAAENMPPAPAAAESALPAAAADQTDLESGTGMPATAEDLDLPPVMSLSPHPNLDEFINVGLTNFRPLSIAQKELELAKKKLFESRRNLLPTVSAKGSQSSGKTQTNPDDPTTVADFKRKEVGVELGQTIFQSGRLYYAEKQAKAQREVAQLQIEKITQEQTFEITRALFTYLQAREAVKVRKNLQQESNKIVELTRRKKDIGVASEAEYLGVLSAGTQVTYRALAQEKDLEIAKTRLLGMMNVESMPDDVQVSLNEAAMPSAEGLKLENLVASAFVNRPSIKIAQLSKRAHEYGRKVSRAEKLLKVDASGFVGQSGAAFGSEPLNMQDSYNVGIKGVLYFGGSSLNPMYTSDKSAPDLGTTSRTETRSQSISVGLLDSLGVESGYLQAVIDKEKASEDYSKTRKEVLLDVQEAYYNYQKARFQIESARKELEYRSKEADIATARDRLHQIEAPQYLQALGSRAEAEVGLKEAIGFYRIAFAALEKATGVRQLR